MSYKQLTQEYKPKNTKKMDKRILLPLAILPAFQAGNVQAADQLAKRPNIILFMVDDMGWEDTSLPFWTEKTHYN